MNNRGTTQHLKSSWGWAVCGFADSHYEHFSPVYTQKPGNRGWKLERQMMTWKVRKRQEGTRTGVAETGTLWSLASRGLKKDRSGRGGRDLGIELETGQREILVEMKKWNVKNKSLLAFLKHSIYPLFPSQDFLYLLHTLIKR